MLLTKIFLKVDMKWSQPHASDKAHFKVLQKEKEGIFIMSSFALVMLSCFAMPWPCPASLDKICTNKKTKIFSSTIDSPCFGEKKKKFTIQLLFTYYYSLSLFIRYCSWYCSLRIFAYLRGVVPYVWNKFYFRTSFLERVSPSRPFFERVPYLL